jgi:hypothetical protein
VKFQTPIYAGFHFQCSDFRGVLEVLDIVVKTDSGWNIATYDEVRDVAEHYELPTHGLMRDEIIDSMCRRRSFSGLPWRRESL